MSLMNPYVKDAAGHVLDGYTLMRIRLAGQTVQQLTELEHEMEHLRRHPDFSIRTGAEIVRAAAVMEREAKAHGLTQGRKEAKAQDGETNP